MAAKNNSNGFGNHVGTSSILLIFIVLCLVSFAGLSIVSANADFILTDKIATRTSAYYEASNAAQDELSELDLKAQKAFTSTSSEDEYKSILGADFSFTEVISDTQYLLVEGNFLYPGNQNGPFYEIMTYKVLTNTADMTYDDTLPLMK